MIYDYVVITFVRGAFGVRSPEVHSLEVTYQDAVSSMKDAYEYSDVVQIYSIDSNADQLGDF